MKRILQTIVRDTERYSISNSSELSISKPDLYIEKIALQGGETATTDDIVVTRSGKNLLDGNLRTTPKTQNGITIQYLPDEDCYLLNGTSTITENYYLLEQNLLVNGIVTPSIVHISGTVSGNGTSVFYIGYRDDLSDSNHNWVCIHLKNNIISRNSYTSHQYISRTWFYITPGVIFDNYKIKIQIEKGLTVTEYEPYLPPKSLTFSRDYLLSLKGANNLLDKSKFPATQTIKGITYTNNGDGTITANGTAESGSGFRLDIFYIEGNKTYLMRGCPKEGAANKYFIFDGYGNTGSDLGSGVIKTVSGSDSVKCSPILYIVTGHTVSNLVFIPELFDLTSIYGEGNEPTTVEQFLKDYPLSSADKLTITKNSVKYNDTDITSEVTGLDEFFSIDADVSTIITSANIALGEITEDISYSVKSNKRAVYTGEDVIYSSQTFIKE